ncbi:methyl-accepting chemotaxis protein [Tritonibacter aquimaris]|nr:methyl-accepting chemotaxis protein [Tritonibacter aquimaris]
MRSALNTISGKLLITITLAITLLAVSFSVVKVWRVSNAVHQQTLEHATLSASDISNTLASELTGATATALAMSGALSGFLQKEPVAANDVSNLLKGVSEQHGSGFFTWMAAIPGGIADTRIIGDEGRNADGVFTPYWTKSDSGALTFETFTFKPDTDAEWYRDPIVTGEVLITEPYLSQEERLLTSVAVPVFLNGKVAAVAGVDIVLDNLTELVAGLSVFEGGSVMLLGQSGNWLANPDTDLLTKAYEGPGADAITTAVETGALQIVSDLSDGTTRLFYPFTAFSMNKTWVVVMDVPRDVFVTPVRESIKEELIVNGLLLAFTLITIFFATRKMVQRPLSKMLISINALSEGRVNQDNDLPKGKDEIGITAAALEKLRQGLVEKQNIEQGQLEAQENQKKIVQSLADGMQKLASGDLTSKLNEAFPEHYEQLRQDFNATVDTLGGMVSQVVDSAQSIRSGAAEISQASDDLSHRTESQAATLEETAAALDELTASVKSAADGAREVEATMTEARHEAENNRTVVQNAVSAMTEIEQSSNHIGQIISVIDDIAFQTNLLALNAGVEAARAGEAGRGFAVVASEVRALAQRSSDAAMEIKSLVQESSQQVDRGVTLVGKAGEALQSIVQQIAKISEQVSGIAEGAAEQSTGLHEINTGVTQLDQVTQQNAAMVEEATAAGHLLNTDAGKLAEIVGRFKVSGASAMPLAPPSQPSSAPSAHGDDDWGLEETAPAPMAANGSNKIWQDF